ncbi:MAG: serine/threonine-protein kinase [Gemmatimonadaceae bacterium]
MARPLTLTPERLAQVKRIFGDALELDPNARAAFVATQSGDDVALRDEVLSLLRADARAVDSWDTAAADVLAKAWSDVARDDYVGVQVGAYRLTRLIGVGGMGSVYEGLRTGDDFSKRVAVKLLRRGAESDLALQRFRNERQILATLSHKNIAALIDGGIAADGQPFFIMEYVDGVPITEYCAARHLGVRDRLLLFRQVCAAVQYAHQNLVIHRDIKPGNILVGADGTVKLLDFGIARLTREGEPDSALPATRDLGAALTPEYASPEQLQGRALTTTSDIYSLGVVLFELLTGRRPFDTADKSLREIETIITGEPAPRPSAAVDETFAASTPDRRVARLRTALRGDLDAIVLFALRKEPERRYQSAEQFAEDVRRYLGGLPVLAQRDWLGYRIGKFLRRRPIESAASLLVVMSLVGGIVTTTRQARRAQLEQQKTTEVNTFLTDMLSSVDPGNNGRDVRVAQALAAAARKVDSLQDAPELEAALRETIGRTYTSLGLFPEAEHHLGRNLTLARVLHGEHSPEFARALRLLGDVHEGDGNIPEWERLERASIDIWNALPNPDPRERITAMVGLAKVYQRKGQFKESEALHREALALRKPLGVDPGYIANINDLAVAIGQQGRLVEAESLHRVAVTLAREHEGPESLDLATGLGNLATILEFQHKVAPAESAYRQALPLQKQHLGAGHSAYALTLLNYAQFEFDQGQFHAAETAARELLSYRGKTLGDSNQTTPAALQLMAMVLDSLGPIGPQAEQLFRESLRLRRSIYGDDHWLVASSESVLGHHLALAGKLREAQPLLEHAYARLLEKRGADASITKVAKSRLDYLRSHMTRSSR